MYTTFFFVSDLVGNPEDRFSPDTAQMVFTVEAVDRIIANSADPDHTAPQGLGLHC